MSRRIDRSWRVHRSIESEDGTRCVDFFVRPDGTFGFEEFRRDPEDRGDWTPVAYYSAIAHPTEDAAIERAQAHIVWLLYVEPELHRPLDEPRQS